VVVVVVFLLNSKEIAMEDLRRLKNQEGKELLKDIKKEFLSDRDLDGIGIRDESTLRNDRWQGKSLIPHFKVGKNIRYWKKDVIEYLKANRVPAKS